MTGFRERLPDTHIPSLRSYTVITPEYRLHSGFYWVGHYVKQIINVKITYIQGESGESIGIYLRPRE